MNRAFRWGLGLSAGIGILFFVLTPATPPRGETFAQDTPATDPLHPVQTFIASAAAHSLSAAFAENDQPYYLEDQITAFPDPTLGLGSVVTVRRAMPVTIKDGKRQTVYRTWQTTVGGLIAERHLDLGAEDRVNLAMAAPLETGSSLTITRVARTTVSEFERIPFQTIEQDDPSRWRGDNTITQEGKNGKREKKYLVIREDGELKSKTLTANTVVEAAVNKIIKIGSKLKIGQSFSGRATYYENSYGTKVATDKFKRGVELRVTNLNNGRSIIVRNDGCICGNNSVLVDLNPAYFRQLGGTLGQGVLANVKIEEILN